MEGRGSHCICPHGDCLSWNKGPHPLSPVLPSVALRVSGNWIHHRPTGAVVLAAVPFGHQDFLPRGTCRQELIPLWGKYLNFLIRLKGPRDPLPQPNMDHHASGVSRPPAPKPFGVSSRPVHQEALICRKKSLKPKPKTDIQAIISSGRRQIWAPTHQNSSQPWAAPRQ